MSDSSDDDGDYSSENPGIPGATSSIRYPVHDFAEFEDAETLRVSCRYHVAVMTTHRRVALAAG
jgi:hypothetical protein